MAHRKPPPIVALMHLKGGVGKSTVAVSLSHLLAVAGNRVLLADLDAQGASTWMLGGEADGASAKALVRGKKSLRDDVIETAWPNLDLMPASFSLRTLPERLDRGSDGARQMRSALEKAGKGYDVVIVDAPAGLSLEGEAILGASTVVLVPIVPSPLAADGYGRFVEFARRIGASATVRGFFSMVDRRRPLHRDTVERMPADDQTIWPIVVPQASVMEQVSVRRRPVAVLARSARVVDPLAELRDRLVELVPELS